MLKTKGNSIIFGGCWAYKSGLRFFVWALEVPFSGVQTWDLERPNPKTETTFTSQTSPQKIGIAFGLEHLPLLERFSAHFGILSFLGRFWAIFPLALGQI